jgi:hypothetical protein
LGGEEWVELYNQESEVVELDGWQVDDLAEGGSSPLELSGTINPGDYLVFSLGTRLNNLGDQVRLIRPDGSLADQFEFSQPDPGVAWARDNGDQWRPTAVLTPGRKNVFGLPSPSFYPISGHSFLPSPSPSSAPGLGLSSVSPSPVVRDSGSSNFISQLPIKTPRLTFLKRTEPQILGTTCSGILGGEEKTDRDVQRFWFIGGGLIVLSSLLLVERSDVVRFFHALFSSLANCFGLVFVDLSPFEHPEDLSRRQSSG